MQNVAVRRVRDLDEPAKRWFMNVFGRELNDDEAITLTVFPAHPSPAPEERQQAAAHMDRILDKAADNLRSVTDSEFEAGVDEAMQQVRRWQP